jgi:hypothetical protein
LFCRSRKRNRRLDCHGAHALAFDEFDGERMDFALGLHGLKPSFAWFQTQDKPAKNGGYFLTHPYLMAARFLEGQNAFLLGNI